MMSLSSWDMIVLGYYNYSFGLDYIFDFDFDFA